ncbi:MAG: helix-hairpin-helix domain-containing protein [Thermoplasmata archaeon]
MSTNLALAESLREIADLLDLQGERFKPEAYRRAARSLEALAEDLRTVAGRGGLEEIPGVGEAIAEKIREFLRSGSVPYLDRLRRDLPPGLVEIMHLPGLGPKTTRRFWIELGIEGPAELAEAIETGRLAGVKGFGPRKIELIRSALAARGTSGQRVGLLAAHRVAERILAALRANPAVDRVEAAGSLRRRRESIGDLDILVTSTDPERVFDAFTAFPEVTSVTLRGPTKETVVWSGGLQVDLRVVEPSSFGAALQYFTGSKDHNVHLRGIARDRGLKVNEYGVFRGEERVASATEEDVYARLDLPWIPPEIRENHGEIEAAAKHALPHLVEATDLQGTYHVHVGRDITSAGIARIEDALRARRLAYVGLVVGVPPGSRDVGSPPAVLPRSSSTSDPPSPRRSLRIGWGFEIDLPTSGVLPDASEEWDFWVGRPASGADAPTSRPDRPPLVLAHLTYGATTGGGTPEGPAGWVSLARAWDAALDLAPEGPLDSTGMKAARAAGVPVHLAPAADPREPFEGLDLSLGVARRGWAEKGDILNARPMVQRSAGGASRGARTPPRPSS